MFSTQLKPSPNTDPLNYEMPTTLSLTIWQLLYQTFHDSNFFENSKKPIGILIKSTRNMSRSLTKYTLLVKCLTETGAELNCALQGLLKKKRKKGIELKLFFMALENRKRQTLRRCRA